MRGIFPILAAGIAIAAVAGFARQDLTGEPYKVLKAAKVGGDGGFDYVYADSEGRRLYVPRSGPTPRISVFDLDTLQPVIEIPNFSAHGVAVDPRTHHGFATSKPVVMFDSQTLKVIKTIDVEGHPDGILFDPFNQRVYILSHSAPNATVIDAKDGSVVGTIDLGGAPEQAATDDKGHLYIDIEDKGNVAAVDAKTMQVTVHYSLGDNKAPARCFRRKTPRFICGMPQSGGQRDHECARRQDPDNLADRRGRRRRRVQPTHDGIVQFAARRDAHRDQRERPYII